jgi:hypothetical protein
VTRQLVTSGPSMAMRNLVQAPIPISTKSWAPNSASFGSNNWTTTFVASGGPPRFPGDTVGAPYQRITLTAAFSPAVSSDAFFVDALVRLTSTLSSTFLTSLGRRYKIGLWVRSSVAQGWRINFQPIKGNGGGTTGAMGPNTWVPPDIWQPLSVTGIITDATCLRQDLDLTSQDVRPWPAGTTIDVTMGYAYEESPANAIFTDGAAPGWRWTGTSGQSESVGPQFDPPSLVGKPYAWYEASRLLGEGVALPADGTAVSQWNDLSGNNRHLVQATSANRPILKTLTGQNLMASAAARASSVGSNAGKEWASSTWAGSSLAVETTNPLSEETASLRATCVSAPASSQLRAHVSNGGASAWPVVVRGRTIYASVTVRNDSAGSRPFAAYLQAWNASGVGLGSIQFAYVTVPAATEMVLTGPVTVPAGWAEDPGSGDFLVLSGSAVVDDTFVVGRAQVSREPIVHWSPPCPMLAASGAFVQFDGAGDHLALTGLDLPQGATVYAVARMRRTKPAAEQRFISFRNTDANGSGFYIAQSTASPLNIDALQKSDSGTVSVVGRATSPDATHPFVVSAKFSSSTGITLAINGQSINNATSYSVVSATGIARLDVGSGVAGTQLPGQVDLATVLIFNRSHTAAEISSVERWLGHKYGILVA